jgi:hypothetical protein
MCAGDGARGSWTGSESVAPRLGGRRLLSLSLLSKCGLRRKVWMDVFWCFGLDGDSLCCGEGDMSIQYL